MAVCGPIALGDTVLPPPPRFALRTPARPCHTRVAVQTIPRPTRRILASLVALVVVPAPTLQPGTAEAAYPGVNGALAYTSDLSGNAEIWSMFVGTTQLTFTVGGVATDASFSADGLHIVRTLVPSVGDPEIWSMDSDGSNLKQLTSNKAIDGHPDYSPNGKWIAFDSRRDGDKDVYVMRANGSHVTKLTPEPSRRDPDIQPAWSPDGRRIAFASRRHRNWDVYSMDAVDGASVRRLTRNPNGDSWPDWAPNGRRIVFQSMRTTNYDLFTMRADGSGVKRVTTALTFDQTPVYSPDGTLIAYTCNDGDSEICEIYPDGTGFSQLTFNTALDAYPSWQPQ